MSLDIWLEEECVSVVYDGNYTHNVTSMAAEAGIYKYLWRHGESGVVLAAALVDPLQQAIAYMEREPERFTALNPENGWGSYATFLPWLKGLLSACVDHPCARVRAST